MKVKHLETKTFGLCLIRIGPFGSETSEPKLKGESRDKFARRIVRKYGIDGKKVEGGKPGELIRMTIVDQHIVEIDGVRYSSDLVNHESVDLKKLEMFHV